MSNTHWQTIDLSCNANSVLATTSFWTSTLASALPYSA